MRQIIKGEGRPPQKPVVQFKVMLTTGDVARLLNVHISTVRRWSNQGVLKTYRVSARGDRRFWREDIVDILKEGQIE